MKAYIDRNELIKIIKEHTVFSKATDIPDGWKWYVFKGEEWFLTWDFTPMEKVLVNVEIAPDWIQQDRKKGFV